MCQIGGKEASSENIHVDGKSLLLASATGDIDDMAQSRKILEADSALRASSVVVSVRHRHRSGGLLHLDFALTEPSIRALGHNDEAHLATYECMRIDDELLNAFC